MNTNFNLVRDKWIPLTTSEGTGLYSLKDIFTIGENLISLNLNPIGVLSFMSFLLSIVHRALFLYKRESLRNEESWFSCKDDIKKYTLKYIIEHEELFNLYGDHAFMQVSHMKERKPGETTPIRKMFINLSSGNGANTHQDISVYKYEDNDNFSDAEVALKFVQYLSVNNIGAGISTISGIVDGYNYPISKNGTFSFSQNRWNRFIHGKNIIDTLWYNIVTFEMFEKYPEYRNMMDNPYGVPFWEYDLNSVFENNEKIPETQLASLIGKMVPLNFMFRILDNRKFLMNIGIPYSYKNEKGKNVSLRDKYIEFNSVNASYDKKNKEWTYKQSSGFQDNANESYTLGAFRSLGTCLESTSDDFWCKKHLFTLANKGIHEDIISSCISIGHKKSLPLNSYEWTTPLNTCLMNDINLKKFENLMKIASKISNGGGIIIKNVTNIMNINEDAMKKEKKTLVDIFVRSFWNNLFLENDGINSRKSVLTVESLLETYGNDERKWIDICINAARKAYVKTLERFNIDAVTYYSNYDKLYYCGNFNNHH